MKRTANFLPLAVILLIVTVPAFCDAADVYSTTANVKPCVMNGVILDYTNAIKELKPEEQVVRFKSGWDGMISNGTKAIELKPDSDRA